MPFEHLVDHGSRLVVVRGTGEGSLEETYDSVDRLLKDQSIGYGYRFMFVIDDIALNPTQEEMSIHRVAHQFVADLLLRPHGDRRCPFRSPNCFTHGCTRGESCVRYGSILH